MTSIKCKTFFKDNVWVCEEPDLIIKSPNEVIKTFSKVVFSETAREYLVTVTMDGEITITVDDLIERDFFIGFANAFLYLINYTYFKQKKGNIYLYNPVITERNCAFDDSDYNSLTKGSGMCSLRKNGFDPRYDSPCKDQRISEAMFIDSSVLEDSIKIIKETDFLSLYSSKSIFINHAITDYSEGNLHSSIINSFRVVEDYLKKLISDLDNNEIKRLLIQAKSDNKFTEKIPQKIRKDNLKLYQRLVVCIYKYNSLSDFDFIKIDQYRIYRNGVHTTNAKEIPSEVAKEMYLYAFKSIFLLNE